MSQLEIRAPAEQTEGTRSQILRWLKSIGDSVNENEPLIEIETDKVTVEVASPGSGTLREILKQEQEEITPGDLLGRIDMVGAASEPLASQTARSLGVSANGADAQGANAQEANARGADARGIDAQGVDARAEARPHASAAPNGAFNVAPNGAEVIGATSHTLSPAVRRLLVERGLDASAVHGTGQAGRVTVADVLAHKGGSGTGSTGSTAVGSRGGGQVSAPARGGSPPGFGGSAVARGDVAAGFGDSAVAHGDTEAGFGGSAVARGDTEAGLAVTAAARGSTTAGDVAGDSATAAPSHRVPHTTTRRRIAERMVQSLLHTAPHVTTVFEADLTAVLEHRQQNKGEFARQNVPLTLTAYFLQATVAALRAVPEANSRWTDTALEVFDSMHIGVATALETGLVVPVLRDVQSLDLFETARRLDDLVVRAREGKLSPSDMRGGTFTISNHGVSGSLVATPIIINQPQSAILGVGKLEKRPVVVSENGEDRLAIRPQCYVTLTIDHRVMDGHQANRFLQTFVQRLASSHG
jgi:2-oxoglutarate dehydrogenase E2 component (dihydrolipoamide succinyltransferase)